MVIIMNQSYIPVKARRRVLQKKNLHIQKNFKNSKIFKWVNPQTQI